MAELFAIGDLGDTTDDVLDYASGVASGIVSAFDPFAGAVVTGADDASSGGDSSGGDSSGGGGVPLGEGDFGGGGGASGSVPDAASPVVFTGGTNTPVQEIIGGGGASPVTGGGNMAPVPSAPIGPGTTTPTAGTPWVKYGAYAVGAAVVAYFAWKMMKPRRANPGRRRHRARRRRR
jgi:hypothetical protein